MTNILIDLGDITEQMVDAIVNAAGPTLLGGGGVDGAIHFAAGPNLLKECQTLGGCKTGEAKITHAYNLSSKYIIHTVGPVYGKENGKESILLRSCYENSLLLAKQHAIKSIAFPAISTGAYRFPKKDAVVIVYDFLSNFIKQDDNFSEIRLVLHSTEDFVLYKNIFT